MQSVGLTDNGTSKSLYHVSLRETNHTQQWRCGHDRTPENSVQRGEGRTRCRTCANARNRRVYAEKPYVARQAKHDRLSYRQRYLPIQLEATERKLAMLRREAVRIGLGHLVEAR